MKAPRLIPFVLVAAVAAAGGYYLRAYRSGRTEPATGAAIFAVAPQPVQPALPPAGARLPSRLAAILGDQPLTDANAGTITYRALEESNPVSRMAATGVILESMTASNAHAVYQAFRDIMARTGRRHDAEWGLMLKRYGEVSGAEGLNAVAPHTGNMAFIIEGMASVDPDAAAAALAAAGVENPSLSNAWLAGLCRNDPDKALARALSGEYEDVNTDALLAQAIHTSGLDGARAAIQKALDAAKGEVAGDPVFLKLVESLGESIFHRHLIDGTHGEILSWLEQLKGQPYLPESLIDKGARETASSGKTGEALAWLERMNDGQPGSTTGGQGLFEAITLNPKIMADMDAATFARVIPRLPQSRNTLEILAAVVEPVNPEYARQLRASLPPPDPPAGGEVVEP